MQSVWSMLDGQYICIFILSLNRLFCLLVPDEGFLDIQSKSYILYISNKIWFVCQSILRRIYKISHINFLPFSCHLSPCVVLCYCHNVNFFSSNGSLILMLCLLSDHLDQRWYDWLQKLNGFSFDIYYFLWHLSNIKRFSMSNTYRSSYKVKYDVKQIAMASYFLFSSILAISHGWIKTID